MPFCHLPSAHRHPLTLHPSTYLHNRCYKCYRMLHSADSTPSPAHLLERRILLCVRLAVEGGGDEMLRWDHFAAEIFVDGVDGGGGDLGGVLEDGRIELAILHRLLGFGLAVKANDLDARLFASAFDGGDGAQGRGVVDGEDGIEVGLGLEKVLRGRVGAVACAAAGELGDDLDAGDFGDFFGETLGAHEDGFNFGMIENGDFAFALEELDHRPARNPAALEVVGGGVGDDFRPFGDGGDVGGEDGDAGLIGLGNGGADAAGVAGGEDDGGGFTD